MEPLIFRAANRVADAIGIFKRPLLAAELIGLAQKRTKLTDFGEWSFEAPLKTLLSSYEHEANLSAFGRIAARWDTLRLLTNLLVLRDAERLHPAILSQPIEKPIFITGLPRSGTSFLHDLLAATVQTLSSTVGKRFIRGPEDPLIGGGPRSIVNLRGSRDWRPRFPRFIP